MLLFLLSGYHRRIQCINLCIVKTIDYILKLMLALTQGTLVVT